MLKVYFDNDVASGISKRDCAKAEVDAIDQLLAANRAQKIMLGALRQSLREMERAPSEELRAKLKTGLSELILAEHDHIVLGCDTQTDYRGTCSSNPLVTDIVDEHMYSGFRAAGLKADDAKHLMYAAYNGYDRFLTCDKGILSRRFELEKVCPSIKIQKPSEFVADGWDYDRRLPR